MPLMTWNDKLSVGIESIDADHKKLVALINELYDGILAGHGKEALAAIAGQLVDYTRFHFAREEEFFAMTSYMGAEEHKREHDQMAAWASRARAEFEKGSLPAASLEAMVFLKDWLYDHVLGSDQKFGPYLNAMGIH